MRLLLEPLGRHDDEARAQERPRAEPRHGGPKGVRRGREHDQLRVGGGLVQVVRDADGLGDRHPGRKTGFSRPRLAHALREIGLVDPEPDVPVLHEQEGERRPPPSAADHAGVHAAPFSVTGLPLAERWDLGAGEKASDIGDVADHDQGRDEDRRDEICRAVFVAWHPPRDETWVASAAPMDATETRREMATRTIHTPSARSAGTGRTARKTPRLVATPRPP